MKEGRTETIRLLLKASQTASSSGSRPTQPALRITITDNDVKCLYTYPTPFTPTTNGAYIPSVFTSDSYSFYHGACRSLGIICLQILEGAYIFVQWGVETSIHTNTYYEYVEGPSTGWCKILGGGGAVDGTQGDDVPVWQKFSVERYPAGDLQEQEFVESAKRYLATWQKYTKLSSWDVKAWPRQSADVSARTKCTLSIESASFLGQNHLEMQVRFS